MRVVSAHFLGGGILLKDGSAAAFSLLRKVMRCVFKERKILIFLNRVAQR